LAVLADAPITATEPGLKNASSIAAYRLVTSTVT